MPFTEQQLVIGVIVLMGLWYLAGTWYNRRRGIRTLTWLRDGLQSLGGRLEMSWLGSAASGARAVVHKAQPPFRQLNAIFLLESRELLPLWLANLLRGKRDELIIKADLRTSRRGEIEVVPAGSRLERSLLQEHNKPPWQWEAGPHGLHIGYRGPQGKELVTAVASFLEDYGPYLHRFSWRRDKPHLLLHTRLAGLIDRPPTEFFKDLSSVISEQ